MTLAVERRGAIALIRYDHPPRNFATTRLLHDLRVCFRRLDRDPTVHVIVLTGARDGHFMLHVEVEQIRAMLASAPPLPLLSVAMPVARGVAWLLGRWAWLADRVLSARSEHALARNALLEMMILFDAVERSSKITIAAINGSCVGAGLELSLCFDHRVMLDEPALRIGCPEVLIGLLPGFGGSQRLARQLGTSRTLDLLLGGDLLTPQHAAAIGLVSRAIPAEAFWPEVDALAARFARRPPHAAAAIKRAVRRGGTRSLGQGLAVELREVARLARSPETRSCLDDYGRELERQLALPEVEQPTLAELAASVDAGPGPCSQDHA
jgi:enoyl-CoA hydratase/carnithine racemase